MAPRRPAVFLQTPKKAGLALRALCRLLDKVVRRRDVFLTNNVRSVALAGRGVRWEAGVSYYITDLHITLVARGLVE
jgi:hypothetical protein